MMKYCSRLIFFTGTIARSNRADRINRSNGYRLGRKLTGKLFSSVALILSVGANDENCLCEGEKFLIPDRYTTASFVDSSYSNLDTAYPAGRDVSFEVILFCCRNPNKRLPVNQYVIIIYSQQNYNRKRIMYIDNRF